MSKNANTEVKRGRGRPRTEVNLPKGNRFTISDILASNPKVKCRLTIYSRRDEWIKNKIIKLTGNTIPTGGIGKPLDEYILVAALKRSQASKKAAKTRKMNAKLPVAAPVDLTPTPVTTPVAAPVAA